MKKAATQRLAAPFVEVDELLEDGIDAVVFPMHRIHPEFYAAYQAARMVVNRPGRRSESGDASASPPAVVPNGSSSVTPLPAAQPQAA